MPFFSGIKIYLIFKKPFTLLYFAEDGLRSITCVRTFLELPKFYKFILELLRFALFFVVFGIHFKQIFDIEKHQFSMIGLNFGIFVDYNCFKV